MTALAKTYPDLNRVIEEHATDEGRALLARLEGMTTVEAVIRLFKTDMDDLVRPPLEEVLAMPEVQDVFDRHQAGRDHAQPAGADRAGRARLGDRRRRHRRAGAHLPLAAGRR